MNAFPVGTICIGVGFVHELFRNGMECEVVGGLMMRIGQRTATGEIFSDYMYRVKWSDGLNSVQRHPQLRRKQPPQTFTGEQRIAELFLITPMITEGETA